MSEDDTRKRSYDEMSGSEDVEEDAYDTEDEETLSEDDEFICEDCGNEVMQFCPRCEVLYVKPPLMYMEPGQLYMYKGYDAKKQK